MKNENKDNSFSSLSAQLEENNKKISTLLSENEDILRRMGYKPPATNMTLNKKSRIIFPSGYIRTKSYFAKKYRLYEFFSNTELASNMAYALQLSDLYNFILNRFNIWGPLETMVYKAAIINYVCIIESFIGQVFDDMHKYCGKCDKHNHCEFFMPKVNNFAQKLDAIEKSGILSLTSMHYAQIREAYHLRNHMHIYTAARQNEHTQKAFNTKLHNDIIKIMQIVVVSLYNDMLPATKTCYKDTL